MCTQAFDIPGEAAPLPHICWLPPSVPSHVMFDRSWVNLPTAIAVQGEEGPDKACLERSVDEVAQYLDSRYCGTPEAAWRLFGFPLQGRSHHVERLPIHLPLQKNVLFSEGSEAQAAANALSRDSKLEAWFRLNASADSYDPQTAALILSLRYPEIPRHFVWDVKKSYWKLRARSLKDIIFVLLDHILYVALACLDYSFCRSFDGSLPCFRRQFIGSILSRYMCCKSG